MIMLFESYNKTTLLRRFSEEHLISILDNGIDIQIEVEDNTKYTLFIQKFGYGFKWVDVKDTLITFLIVLSDNYNVESKIRFGLSSGGRHIPHKTFSIEDIIDDNIEISPKINIITIAIDLSER